MLRNKSQKLSSTEASNLICETCNKTFAKKHNLKRHRRQIHQICQETPEKECSMCSFKTNSIAAMAAHFRILHNNSIIKTCSYCCLVFGNKEDLYAHLDRNHGLPISSCRTIETSPIETAFNGALKIYTLPGTPEQDLLEFMLDKKPEIDALISANVNLTPRKVQFCVAVNLEKPLQEEKTKVFIRSPMVIVYKEGLSIDEFLNMADTMFATLVTFTASGSGWIINEIVQLDVKFALFNPINGSTYIALPGALQGSKALLNIRNHNDDNCFLLCFTAAWHLEYGPPLYRPGQESWRRKTSPLTYSPSNPLAHQAIGDFEMPMGIKQIPKFEHMNDCKINVFR